MHVPNFIKNWSICSNFQFSNGVHLPSWISSVHIWTTHKEYLVVFITVQSLVAIDAEVVVMNPH